MTPQAAKAKGRRLQQYIRDCLRKVFQSINPLIEDDDVESRGMGQAGEDIILTPAARRIWNGKIECKNCEKLNVQAVFSDHYKKHNKSGVTCVLVWGKNHTQPLAILRWEDFVPYLIAYATRDVRSSLPQGFPGSDGELPVPEGTP